LLRGEFRDARSLYKEAIAVRRELGDRLGLARALEGAAALAAAEADSLVAARTWGAAERLREEIGSPISPNERPRHEGHVASARAAAGDQCAFDRAWGQGRDMPINETIDLAVGAKIPQQ
jgi:non-specific serine/threonine protein kinase